MKAIYRGPTIVLIPETDNEADSLVFHASTGKYLMGNCTVNGQPVPCWEFPVGVKETYPVPKDNPNGTVQ